MEAHKKYPHAVNIWAGVVETSILEPFFIEYSLTGEKYLEMMQRYIIPEISAKYLNAENHDLPGSSMWHQHDGIHIISHMCLII